MDKRTQLEEQPWFQDLAMSCTDASLQKSVLLATLLFRAYPQGLVSYKPRSNVKEAKLVISAA
eukprot:867078-Amphidinium_carterae.1